MNVTVGKKLGTVTKGSVREWKQSPGSDNAACHAAVYYAKKNKQDMVVVPGNSYGSFVLHVARETDDLSKFVPGVGDKEISGYLAKPNGDVFEARLSK